MIQENLLYFAIAVFVFMLIGLTLTVLEFSYGAPKKQAEAEPGEQSLNPPR